MAAVASRYARAFADVALSLRLDAEAALAELNSLVEMLQASPDLRKVWENPAIAGEQKLRLLDALAARAALSVPVRNFVAVIIDHRRVAQLAEIARHLRAEFNRRMGMIEAAITSARPLADAQRSQLEAHIAATTGGNVRAHYSTDPQLLGGAVVRIGSTIYDGSVRGQLHRMREKLAEG